MHNVEIDMTPPPRRSFRVPIPVPVLEAGLLILLAVIASYTG